MQTNELPCSNVHTASADMQWLSVSANSLWTLYSSRSGVCGYLCAMIVRDG